MTVAGGVMRTARDRSSLLNWRLTLHAGFENHGWIDEILRKQQVGIEMIINY